MKFGREARIGHAPVASSQVNPGPLQGSSRRNARMTSSDISTRDTLMTSRAAAPQQAQAYRLGNRRKHSSPSCHMLYPPPNM